MTKTCIDEKQLDDKRIYSDKEADSSIISREEQEEITKNSGGEEKSKIPITVDGGKARK